jgi:hypothetical protein
MKRLEGGDGRVEKKTLLDYFGYMAVYSALVRAVVLGEKKRYVQLS